MHVLWLFRFIVTIDLSVSFTLIIVVGRITIRGKKHGGIFDTTNLKYTYHTV